MKNLRVLVGQTIVAAMLFAAMPASGQTPATAESYFNEGVEAVNAGRWEKAVKLFTQSLQLEDAINTKAWLGRSLVESGELVAGAVYLETYLGEAGKDDASMRNAVDKMLAGVKAKIATIQLDGVPEGAEVFVDGNRIEDKRLSWPIYLAPGVRHSFEVKRTGFVPWKHESKFGAGEVVKLPVPTLQPEVKKPNPADLNKDKPIEVSGSGLTREAKIGFAVGGALTAVAVGTGIWAGVTYSPMSDAKAKYEILYAKYGKDCSLVSDCRTHFDTYQGNIPTMRGLMIASTAVGALAAGAFVFALVQASSESKPQQTGQVAWSVGVGPGTGSIRITF